jgi:hypothetical protein
VGGGGSRALFSFRGQKIIIIVIIIIIVVYPEIHMSSRSIERVCPFAVRTGFPASSLA